MGALGLLTLPSQLVEVSIAATILVSALHALRPLFAGREPLVAASFGLVHGLAFASAFADLGLEGWDMALSLLFFNLGIEAMQLIIVVATIPPLMLVSGRSQKIYAAVRIGGGLIGAAAACGWLAERAVGLELPRLY